MFTYFLQQSNFRKNFPDHGIHIEKLSTYDQDDRTTYNSINYFDNNYVFIILIHI